MPACCITTRLQLGTARHDDVGAQLGHLRNVAAELDGIAKALIADQHQRAFRHGLAVPLRLVGVRQRARELAKVEPPFIFLPHPSANCPSAAAPPQARNALPASAVQFPGARAQVMRCRSPCGRNGSRQIVMGARILRRQFHGAATVHQRLIKPPWPRYSSQMLRWNTARSAAERWRAPAGQASNGRLALCARIAL